MNLRAATIIFFLATAFANAVSAMYIFGAYASGLPTKWWSGPLVLLMLAAALGMAIAGVAVSFSRSLRVLALFSGGFLELLLAVGLIYGFTLWLGGRLAWGVFTELVLIPLAVTTPSMVLAFRLRPKLRLTERRF